MPALRAAASTIVSLLATLLASAALAGPVIEVASAFDAGDEVDVHLRLDHDVTWRRTSIERELAGRPGTAPGDPLPVVPDLRAIASRQELTPRLEIGFFTDLAVTAALPIVLLDRRRLDLDPRGVERDGSTTIVDGLLPASGYDAGDPTGPGYTSGRGLFRGADRHGVDQLHLGLAWAPMNQARDRTKPTWKVGLEGRFAIGKVARFDRDAPDDADGVSRGVHELRLWTSVARRIRWAEPHLELWWLGPVGRRASSPFATPSIPFGARNLGSTQRAGGRFGLEAVVLKRPEHDLTVGLTSAVDMEAHLEGREYTEMWEIFALAGDAREGGPLVLDGEPATAGTQARSHPGISHVENYLELGGELGVEVELGDRWRFAARFRYASQQSHLITYADAGVDRPTCTGDRTTGCEVDDDAVVDPGTEEVNPLFVPAIDSVGHRYRAAGGRVLGLGLELRALF
jgi:hypothetical protein